ncbi:MAG: FAD-dependent oxidoreductase [Elusimicrobia bacterium]|nr:FAD-dependent oxidoreductase [Elusimicrobiota bacterium]
MKDIVIIGGGPAAITASIYAARQGMDLMVIAEELGGQAILSSAIENYTGFELISGAELIGKFISHAEEFGIEIKDSVRVTDVKKEGNSFSIYRSDGNSCRARAVIVASGARPRKLGIAGEEEFVGRGLAYCAICDAPIYKDKTALVVGGGNSALDAVRQLAPIAKKVYMVDVAPELGGEAVLRERILKFPNLEVFNSSELTEIQGDSDGITSVTVSNPDKNIEIKTDGVFVEIGWEASSDFVKMVKKNKKGEIIIDSDNRTDVLGLFAAGDVTSVSKKQVIVAAGAGASAALNAIDYLTRLKEK